MAIDLSSIGPWSSDAADLTREEQKREFSPSSFFFSQGRALVLAARYFRSDQLVPQARSGVARKHRHRIHLALFGQLMASLEYLLKDFIARIIDLVPTFDEKIREAKWITVDTERVLSNRSAPARPGPLLLHGTLGWHDSLEVNKRYSHLFQCAPIETTEIVTLNALWILRHSVAHNAGFVGSHDAVRGSFPNLPSKVADIREEHLEDTFAFLCVIARRIAECVGDSVLLTWLRTRVPAGANYKRDRDLYRALKLLTTYVDSRAQPLPKITKGSYSTDFKRAQPKGQAT